MVTDFCFFVPAWHNTAQSDMSTAEELLDAEVAAADQAALAKGFDDAKRNDVKGLLKAQGEGRIYEYMDKWIPRDVKRRLSEERKKAPKLHARRFNHAGKRAPLKRVTKNGRRSNGICSVELSEASVSAFLAKKKAGGGLSRGQVVTRNSASQMAPRSTDGNTKKILEENKLPRQLTSSNIQDNLVTTANDNTDTKISSSRLSAQETATMSTPSFLNNTENICPTSIQSGTKGNATTSFSALRTNLKPIHGGRSSTRDPLSLRASSTNQNNVKVGTSSEHLGSREAAETYMHLRKVDKSSPSLSTPSSVRCTGASDPASFTDSENEKQKSFIGGVKLRPVRVRQELPTVRSLGPKASPQRFPVSPEIATTPAQIVIAFPTSSNPHSTGASSIPRDNNNNIRCDAASVEKFEVVVVSPVEKKGKMKEAASSSIVLPPSSETSLEKKGDVKKNVSSSIMSPPSSETSLEKKGAVAPLSSLKKEVSASTTGPVGDDLSKELEMANDRTSIQDDVVPGMELPPSLTSTPLTQDHMTTSPIRANNTNDLLGHELKVTEYSPEIEDAAAAGVKPLLTPLPTKEEDRTPSASTPLSGSEPSHILGGMAKYTTNIEGVVEAIDPKPTTAASLSSSENTDDAFIENSEETGTTKLGRLHTFFGRLFRSGKKKELSSKRRKINSPSTTNSSAAQEPSSQVEQEHHDVEEATCATSLRATDITTVEQPPTASVASTTLNVSTSLIRSLRFGKKLKKMTKRKNTTTNVDVPTAAPGVVPTAETDSSSASLKRPLKLGGKKLKKTTKRRKTKSSGSEEISSVMTTDLLDGKATTNNTEEDHSATTGATIVAAAHYKSLPSKKKKALIFGRDKNKKMKRMKTSVSNSEGEIWPTDCCASSAKAKSSNNTECTTTDATSIESSSESTMRTGSGLNGKKKDVKMKGKRDGGERQSAIKPTAKNAASANGSLPTAAADNTSSTCLTLVANSKSASTTLKESRKKKKKKTKRNMKKKSSDSKLPSTVQQFSSISLASLAENALSKFMGEAKPKEITPQERVAREQAAFQRSQQQHEALRLPPAGLLGLRQMKLSSPQASVPKDSAMALDKYSFRRRLGIERKASKHHCSTEMFCEVKARMWYGHDEDGTGSSVWATQYAFLKLTEGVLWMGKAGAVMKEVALISKTCTLSHILYVEDEDGKGCVLVIIDDSGSCDGGRKRHTIQICASTDKETKELHQLL